MAGRFFGAWVRGSEAAFKQYDAKLKTLLASLHVEDPATWPEEKFAGMTARVIAILLALSLLVVLALPHSFR
mgnify:CR=1 FL=1